ncbi:WD40 repeat domain-containing protein [Streptomyces nigrescens]|uniref:WD40 repeat domain-containing protein n=1 Tax=Streptomyces nigrescens TaxID=1920 RepID=UPI0039658FA7
MSSLVSFLRPPARSGQRRSPTTARCWRPAASTARSACGLRPPSRPFGNRSSATEARSSRWRSLRVGCSLPSSAATGRGCGTWLHGNWRRPTTACSLLLSAGPSITAMALSPDGRILALGGLMEGVRLCNLQTRQRTWTVVTGSRVPKVLAPKALAFSPDQTWLAVGGDEHSVWLLRTDGGDGAGAALTGHCDTVRAVAFSPDSSLVATASDDRLVRLWAVPRDRSPEPDTRQTS